MTQRSLAEIQAAFADVPRPEHFTNYWHCEECCEHDDTLRRHTPETISLAELGNPGWDPICFIQPAGFLYYMPGLVRLADAAPDEYLDQLLFHLLCDRVSLLSASQRRAVCAWLSAVDAELSISTGDSPTAEQMQQALRQLGA